MSYYGGGLVCESIATTDNARLIAAAPDLLRVVEHALMYIDTVGPLSRESNSSMFGPFVDTMRAAIIESMRAVVVTAKGRA